jgi:hypothetical protein
MMGRLSLVSFNPPLMLDCSRDLVVTMPISASNNDMCSHSLDTLKIHLISYLVRNMGLLVGPLQ